MKYELTDETKEFCGVKLHRIRALRDIPRFCVKTGDLGGWIERENNLSQDGDSWVSGDAMVFGNAGVFKNAKVSGTARVYGSARVSGDARVLDEADVSGEAYVSDRAKVLGRANVFCRARVYDDARVAGNASVSGNAHVYGHANVFQCAKVYGNANAYYVAKVFGDAVVCGDAMVHGDAMVSGCAKLTGKAEVLNSADYTVFKNSWSSGRWFTYTRLNKMWSVGCFYGTGEELIRKAYADSELSGKCYEAIVRAVEKIEEAFMEPVSPSCKNPKYKPMTLDEAIAHAEEAANDTPCGREHKQLADWLRELRDLKAKSI
jgi:carbonic anhydrase/acetyltransferase-like protein (isoleucine patch superfamily)